MRLKKNSTVAIAVTCVASVSVWLFGVYVVDRMELSGMSWFKESIQVEASGAVDVWWPTSDVKISNVQPFKALLKDKAVHEYQMFWQVDGGQYNGMYDSYQDYPHKEAIVDLSSWNWKGAGPYKLSFIAQDGQGNEISRREITIYTADYVVKNSTVAPTDSVLTLPAPAPVAVDNTQAAVSSPSQTQSSGLYVEADSSPRRQANEWRNSRPGDAALMDKIADQSVGVWFGNWNYDVRNDAQQLVEKAGAKGETAVIVAYNIPGRDCGGYSAGGAGSPEGYLSWVRSLADGVGSGRAVVVLEPDALSGADCLSEDAKAKRFDLLRQAVGILKSKSNIRVYLDAGHPRWKSPDDIASRLKSAGIDSADGFSINVSNFISTSENVDYGRKISEKVGGKKFVVDTSRNGSGSSGEWCNPSGRSLGERPTLSTGNGSVDAYLWLKRPGESDGNCNGGPNAGHWWPDYALDLARRAGW